MEDFIKQLIKESVSDIFVSGYTDTDNHMYFHPLYEKIFFTFDEVIYKVYILDGIIYASKVNKINLWFDIDEDDNFSLMSIYSQVFKTEQEVKILNVNYTGKPFSNMSITYKEGEEERKLLLDPNNLFGFVFL